MTWCPSLDDAFATEAFNADVLALLSEYSRQCSCPQHGNWIAADDVKRLVREMDVAINGEAGAARQASLCDIAAQVCSLGLADARGGLASPRGSSPDKLAPSEAVAYRMTDSTGYVTAWIGVEHLSPDDKTRLDKLGVRFEYAYASPPSEGVQTPVDHETRRQQCIDRGEPFDTVPPPPMPKTRSAP